MSIPQILDLLPLPYSETGVFESDFNPVAAQSPLNSLHTFNEALNIATPTSAAAWDLSVPQFNETGFVQEAPIHHLLYRRSHGETVVEGDQRVRVDEADYAPGGRFEAICKLFLQYSNTKEDTYATATGWLVSADTVVTAGHSAYDWTYGQGHLVKVKVFIRYAGKQSVSNGTSELRYGKYVTLPTEYLKGPRDQYDVAFIKLNAPFENVQPLEYAETPRNGSEVLGIVGYPTDLESGEYMYEDCQTVDYDLARNNMTLSYALDPAGGNSGSPVIQRDTGASIGVHIVGGPHNHASAIGKSGNSFPDFLQALELKETHDLTVEDVNGDYSQQNLPSVHIPGFVLTQINTPAPSALTPEPYIPRPLTPLSVPVEEKIWELTVLPEAFGVAEAGKTRPGDHLPLDHALPKIDDQLAAQTIFFANIKPGQLEPEIQQTLEKVQKDIWDYQCWLTSSASNTVQSKINSGALKTDVEIRNYRAKVMDFILKTKSTWVANTQSEVYEKSLDVANVGYIGFHEELLRGALEGVTVPTTAVPEFEQVLQRLVENLRVKEETSYESQQYWIMITVFTYIPEIGTIQATIKTLAFSISRDAYKFIDRKSSLESVKIKMTFDCAQYEFNDNIWSAIKGVLSEEMLKKGEQDLRALTLQPLDISV
ncbi:hypothetical protein TWF102_010294 [Orbilia oligospora]|uniref:Serine protease n=1 Tax=Orbilia oligospora TaxID=2813651 RepID=A0A7C8N4N6_ORBOL|nr:hypothetical protein TWF102_010294 [Orbilia oligospora]KAF3089735.1 hypothetical protein TWF706_010340 [Orbilia oligospora]KAF3108858.1 hypothetical protein TWF103_005447 [Orbilia oligospora]